MTVDNSTLEEMNYSINEARELLLQAWFVKDPVAKIKHVREVLKDLASFDSYWSETYEDDLG